jgi:hypothetical protein
MMGDDRTGVCDPPSIGAVCGSLIGQEVTAIVLRDGNPDVLLLCRVT